MVPKRCSVGFGDIVAGAVVALMNSGGNQGGPAVRRLGNEADGEAFSVHPFGNSLVTMSLTGAQIHALLEQQFDGDDPERGNVLQVSRGFSYTWDASRRAGSRVVASTISIDGVAVEPGEMYRVTVNSFLTDGGSGFSVLTEGTGRTGGMIDLDALIGLFAAEGEVSPRPGDRITRLD